MEIAVGLIFCIAMIWLSVKEAREHPEEAIGNTWGKYFLIAVIVFILISCFVFWIVVIRPNQ